VHEQLRDVSYTALLENAIETTTHLFTSHTANESLKTRAKRKGFCQHVDANYASSNHDRKAEKHGHNLWDVIIYLTKSFLDFKGLAAPTLPVSS
jgi:hypothetical protein